MQSGQAIYRMSGLQAFAALWILAGLERDLESGSRCWSDGVPSSRPRDTPLQGARHETWSRCSSWPTSSGSQDDNMLSMGPSAAEMIDKDEASCSWKMVFEGRSSRNQGHRNRQWDEERLKVHQVAFKSEMMLLCRAKPNKTSQELQARQEKGASLWLGVEVRERVAQGAQWVVSLKKWGEAGRSWTPCRSSPYHSESSTQDWKKNPFEWGFKPAQLPKAPPDEDRLLRVDNLSEQRRGRLKEGRGTKAERRSNFFLF